MNTCLFFTAVLFSTVSLSAQSASLELSCTESDKEPALIQSRAAGVVTRSKKHELQVVTAARAVTFKDKPPYNEPLSGVNHTFCDRKEGFILVNMKDEDVFTGKLINEKSGLVTEGGESLTLSHDRRAYFAAVQPNGLDGMEWKIHAIDGTLSWSGWSFIRSSANADLVHAYLEQPSWQPSGQFSATATCATDPGRTWAVTLVKRQDGWSWRPVKTCPPEKS